MLTHIKTDGNIRSFSGVGVNRKVTIDEKNNEKDKYEPLRLVDTKDYMNLSDESINKQIKDDKIVNSELTNENQLLHLIDTEDKAIIALQNTQEKIEENIEVSKMSKKNISKGMVLKLTGAI